MICLGSLYGEVEDEIIYLVGDCLTEICLCEGDLELSTEISGFDGCFEIMRTLYSLGLLSEERTSDSETRADVTEL